MFWSQPPSDPGPLMLVTPEPGALSPPLQQFALGNEEGAGDPYAEELKRIPSPLQWWDPRIVHADRSFPEAIAFRWMPPPGLRAMPTYDIFLDRSPDFSSPLALTGLRRPEIRIRHLMVDCDYYWYVVATVNGNPVVASEIRHLHTHPSLPRWIRVPDITNMRDLGGWPAYDGFRVRQGLLYRSSEMNGHLGLTDAGRDVLLRELGIRTELDLRGPADYPRPALPEDRVHWVNAPIVAYDELLEEDMHAEIQKIFSLLADPRAYPLVFHCLAGADRAGTIAFLVNGLLGVRLDDLARDYELTSLSVWGERSRTGLEYRALVEALTEIAPPENGRVDRAIGEALRRAGVDQNMINAIRRLLLEPLPQTAASEDGCTRR